MCALLEIENRCLAGNPPTHREPTAPHSNRLDLLYLPSTLKKKLTHPPTHPPTFPNSLSARGPHERGTLGQLDCGRVLLAVMAAHPEARDIQVG